MRWNELSMKDRADVMKLFIDRGIYDLDTIKGEYNRFAEGGGIHIDPSKRGTFTAAASRHNMGVQEFASKVLANKDDYSAAMVKKANFARNASKWHAYGGNLFDGDGGGSFWNTAKQYAKDIKEQVLTPIIEEPQKFISRAIMGYAQQSFPGLANPFKDSRIWDSMVSDHGTPQDTYLMSRRLQDKIFKEKGYIPGKEGDYGLVKKAVGNRKLPIYQTAPDAISRDKLIFLGNDGYYWADHGLENPGSYPHASYTDGHGNFYQKAWDLNDYGGKGGATAGVLGNIVDFIGNPVVTTTGFQKMDMNDPWAIEALAPDMAKKGLVPTKINGKIEWTLPGVTVYSKKKKKSYGGNIFDGDTEPTQQMQQGYIRQRPEGTYFYDVEGQPEIDVTPLNTSLSSNPADWSFTDALGKIYSPHRDTVQGTGELREGNQEGPILSAVNNYLRELNWRAKNDPASIALQGKYTMPTIAATGLLPWLGEAAAATNVAGVPLTTLADAGLTAGFGAHGLNHWINEGINGWGDAAMTALEVAPLGRLVKPIYEGVVQPGMRLFNSPLTGNWTKIGNREYRLSPNSFGANGTPLESRTTVPQITAENVASMTPESPLIASAMSDYSSGLGLDYNIFGRYINEDGSLKKVHIPKTVTESSSKNIDYSNVFKVDQDKRFMMFEPGSFINYDIRNMSTEEIVSTFGPEAEYYKKLYDVAKAHNFEGKYAQIGKDAEYNILNRFAINKSDPDVARGIEEARRIYSIPEYRERFNRWGTLGDTFVDDATARIDNVKLQGRSKKLDIKGQHGVHGGAYTTPDATTIGITNSDSSDWIYNMIRHETNHVGHGLTRQPSWMSYHNEKIRPVLREGKDTTSATGKYLDEMDEIVERSKTAVEYADKIRKEGESLNDALTRLADMADANIYDASIPSDIRQMMARFTKESTLNFWKNFVGGVATPIGIGYGLWQGNE